MYPGASFSARVRSSHACRDRTLEGDRGEDATDAATADDDARVDRTLVGRSD